MRNLKLSVAIIAMTIFHAAPSFGFGLLMPTAVNDYSLFKAIQTDKKITVLISTNGFPEPNRKQLKVAVKHEVRKTLKLISKLVHLAGLREDRPVKVKFITQDKSSGSSEITENEPQKTHKLSEIDLYIAIEQPDRNDGIKTNTMQKTDGMAPLVYIKHDFAALKNPRSYATARQNIWLKANNGVGGDSIEEQESIDEIVKNSDHSIFSVPPLKSESITVAKAGNAMAAGFSRKPLLDIVREYVFVALGFSVPKTRVTGHQFLPFLYRNIGFFARKDIAKLDTDESIRNYFSDEIEGFKKLDQTIQNHKFECPEGYSYVRFKGYNNPSELSIGYCFQNRSSFLPVNIEPISNLIDLDENPINILLQGIASVSCRTPGDDDYDIGLGIYTTPDGQITIESYQDWGNGDVKFTSSTKIDSNSINDDGFVIPGTTWSIIVEEDHNIGILGVSGNNEVPIPCHIEAIGSTYTRKDSFSIN